MENYTGAELVVGECYVYKGKNMGQFKGFRVSGAIHDPDGEYTFENGVLLEFLQRKKVFTKIPCSGGGARRKRVTRKRLSTRRRAKRTRRTRSSRK